MSTLDRPVRVVQILDDTPNIHDLGPDSTFPTYHTALAELIALTDAFEDTLEFALVDVGTGRLLSHILP